MTGNIHEIGAEALNRGDIDAFARLYHADAVVHDPQYAEPLVGRARIREDMVALTTAIADLRVTLGIVLQDTGVSASQYTITGTARGEKDGVRRPGAAITSRASVFSLLGEDGLVVEEHRYYDVASLSSDAGPAT
jgi:steroid delta-isomerase-like uncharacterized protein